MGIAYVHKSNVPLRPGGTYYEEHGTAAASYGLTPWARIPTGTTIFLRKSASHHGKQCEDARSKDSWIKSRRVNPSSYTKT